MAMTRISVETTVAAEGLTEEFFWIKEAVSVTTEPPHEPRRVVEGLFESVDVDDFRRELEALLTRAALDVPISLEVSQIGEQDWLTTWRAGFESISVGGFRLVAEWQAPPQPDQRTILIYPGQAFGTGQHETTQLILARLSELVLTGKRVLDVGCGSGILSIAAEKMGAAEIFGFDSDADCRENMAHHLRINRCQRTRLEIGTLDDLDPEPADLILANITIDVLKRLWPALMRKLLPGGRLLSSGILEEQAGEATAVLESLSAIVVEKRTMGEWVLIESVAL